MRFFVYLCCLQAIYAINYIINGDFSQPACPGSFLYYTVSNWTGNDFVLEGRFNFGLNNTSGQYINLQEHVSSLGFIQQTVVLPSAGNYYLTFYWRTEDFGLNSHYLLVFWNEVVIKTITTLNKTSVCFENITVLGKNGSNVVKFMEPPGPPAFGFILDRISLEDGERPIAQINKPYLGVISQQSVQNLALVVSSSLGQQNIFKNMYLLIDDLWLYNYDNQKYQGLISHVFWTATEIQNLKFTMMQSFVNISSLKKNLGTSDYRNFSTTEFVAIQQASSIFMDSNFAFLIYCVPQNILIGIVLFVLFRLTRQHRMSRYLRKYFFFKTTLVQVLIESNLAYFSFVCFNNLFQTFCFKWQDRAALIFTVLFLFGLLAFSFTYYYLINIFLGKDAYHFVDGLYRCNAGFDYLTIVQLVRNFLRGAICCVLHYHYGSQLLLLTINQLVSLILCLRFQLTSSIFLSSIMYCLSLIYRFLFVVLNGVLYMYWLMSTQIEDVKALLLDLQSVIVYLFASVIILEMMCKFLPIHKKSKQKEQDTENKSRLNKVQKIKKNILQMEGIKTSSKQIKTIEHLNLENSAAGLHRSILTTSRHIEGDKITQNKIKEIKKGIK